jgi:F-type H+-transporting ATPase subunit a
MAGMDPMHQFAITKIVDLPPVNVPGVGPVDLSITNSVLWMGIAALVVVLFFLAAARGRVVPGRLQVVGESLYGLVDGLAGSIIGHEGKKFVPFVFTLFSFILAMNVLGMFIVPFTPTAQIAVTGTLALMTILVVVVVGFARNGLGFFKLFCPSGVPGPLLPLLVVIEVISFLVRPVTLALRLFGNMLGGHVVLKIFAAFVVSLGAFGATGGLASLGFLGAGVSLGAVVALTALEFVVAFLQAFVFAALTCVYLNDVVNLHSH